MSNDYEKKYLENERLAYKFGCNMNIIHDEDMMQNIKLALYKAVVTFDESKGNAFSTYAYKCMLNEYNYSFRNKNNKIKYATNEVYDKEEKLVSIMELIPDEKIIDAQKQVEYNDMYKLILEYLKTIPETDAMLYIDYYFNNINQNKLAARTGLSQGQISRKLSIINKSLQKVLKDYK